MKIRMAALAAALGVFALVVAPLAGAKKPAPGSDPGNSGAAHKCQQGGYLSLVGADGTTFKNVGACVGFAAHGGLFATVSSSRLVRRDPVQCAVRFFIPTTPLAPNTFTTAQAICWHMATRSTGANVQIATGGALARSSRGRW